MATIPYIDPSLAPNDFFSSQLPTRMLGSARFPCSHSQSLPESLLQAENSILLKFLAGKPHL